MRWLVLLLCLFAQTASAAWRDNLIAVWRLNEASGNATDVYGSNTLTETSGTIAAATGKVNGGRDFGGATDTEVFSATDAAWNSIANSAFTVTCWVKFDAFGNYNTIWGKDGTADGNRQALLYYEALSTNKFILNASTTGNYGNSILATATTPSPASTGTWYFIVCSFDPATDILYISVNNGTVYTSAATVTNIPDLGGTWTVGADGAATPGNTVDGIIDEVIFWKRKITAAEITWLYNGGNGRAYAWNPPTQHYQQQSQLERDKKQFYAALGLVQPTHWGLSL